MQKPTSDVFARATALRAEKRTNKEIMIETGLSHSQLERHFMAEDIDQYGGFLAQPGSDTAKAALIAKLRLEGQSWGVISVRFGEPESRTRKAFEEASGLRSKGMRIGKGGRYVSNDQRFYTGTDRAKLGSELVKAEPIAAQVPEDFDAEVTRVLPKVATLKPATKRTRKAKA